MIDRRSPLYGELIYYSMSGVQIETYTDSNKKDVADLILHIQNVEFGIPITLELQPDLNEIPGFYQSI